MMRIRRSFTLIELLIVLIIIGILASLALPTFNSFIWATKCAKAKQTVRTIADSAWRYYVEKGEPIPQPDTSYGKIPWEKLDINIAHLTGDEGTFIDQFKYSYYTFTEGVGFEVYADYLDPYHRPDRGLRKNDPCMFTIMYAQVPPGWVPTPGMDWHQVNETWWVSYYRRYPDGHIVYGW